MEHFVHDENIRHYHRLLEEEKNEDKRAQIRKLLAEEEAKVPAARRGSADYAKHR